MKTAIVILPLIACSSCDHPKETVSARIEKKDGAVTTESIEVVTIDGAKYLRFQMGHGFYGYCPKVNAVAETAKP